ncbi:MAG: dihydrolipoyl dehydrogenase [Phycisphaerales bacterium]|nr:dihydrolipoyl dehydrogenase [Phycisphaerales bacterium]MCI0631899.1 dihydrolipoyl dehydrogenase [Phycisphaerales bacterium]MCI0676755.1 dihydrolipoyl dehydrogenase [Phycisphaerales bacterium]
MVVGEFTQETDLVVIGGGPGGYSCAFRAAELGVSTVIVDAHPSGALGGVCLHDGCIPSKTLLHIADIINAASLASEMGVSFTKPKFKAEGVREWTTKAIAKLAAGLDSQCRKFGVERIKGRAVFEDSRNLAIRDGDVARLRFKRAVVATGSIAAEHPALPFDQRLVVTPEAAMAVSEIPDSMLVVGSGYIAVELASIYAALGSKVSLVDEGEQWLPGVDADIARPLLRRLGDRLRGMWLKTNVKSARKKDGTMEVSFEGDDAAKSARFDRVVVAAGRRPNLGDLHLDRVQVGLNGEGFITVDGHMRTSNPRIFAVGDIAGPPLLADKALAQGRVAAEAIAGKDQGARFDPRAIPIAIFTDPQIAWCGLTEQEAKAEAIPHAAAKIPWGASGRAVGMGRGEGLTKIIYDPPSQLVLGVGMVGPHACEMISEGALAIEMGATLIDLAATIHPHPTLSELVSDAARQAEKTASNAAAPAP